MRQRLRSSLGFANVVSVIALFVALSGTAAAALIVTSNSEIGPNTIYGHNAPSGANKNVIANSLTGADVKESTLGKVPNAANGARRIDYDHPNTDASPVAIATVDEFTLSAECGSSGTGTVLDLYATSTVSADLNYGFIERIDQGNPAPGANGVGLSAGSQTILLDFGADSGFNSRLEGQFVYHNSSRVISVTFHAIANDGTHRCQVTGTALPAPG